MCWLPLCHRRLLCASQAEPTALWNSKSNSFFSTADLHLHGSKGTSNSSNSFYCFFLKKSSYTKHRRQNSPFMSACSFSSAMGDSLTGTELMMQPHLPWAPTLLWQNLGLEMQGQARQRWELRVQGTAYSTPPDWRVAVSCARSCTQCRVKDWRDHWSHPSSAIPIKLKSIDFCLCLSMVQKISRHFWA